MANHLSHAHPHADLNSHAEWHASLLNQHISIIGIDGRTLPFEPASSSRLLVIQPETLKPHNPMDLKRHDAFPTLPSPPPLCSVPHHRAPHCPICVAPRTRRTQRAGGHAPRTQMPPTAAATWRSKRRRTSSTATKPSVPGHGKQSEVLYQAFLCLFGAMASEVPKDRAVWYHFGGDNLTCLT